MSIQVEIKKNLDEDLAKLANLDLAPAYEEIGQDMVSLVRLGFRLSQDPYGDKWEPIKIRKGKPLEDTGHLRQSFHADVENQSVVIGTNVPYASVHQYGATIKPVAKKMLAWQIKDIWFFAKQSVIPARPMIPNEDQGLPDSWSESVVDILLEHISEAANA